MITENSIIPGVYESINETFADNRGSFDVVFSNYGVPFVHFCSAISKWGVIRGLHYHIGHTQDRLIRVVLGAVYDVVLDMRVNSPTFGKWEGRLLTSKFSLFVPKGVAHGYEVLRSSAQIDYWFTDYYYPECERTVLWNDSQLAIDWNLAIEPIVSEKDRAGRLFINAEYCEEK